MKNLLAGNYDQIVTRNVIFGIKAVSSKSFISQLSTCPAIVTVTNELGRRQRHWGLAQSRGKIDAAFIDVGIMH